VRGLPAEAVAAGLHPKGGWAAAAARRCRAGGQAPPAGRVEVLGATYEADFLGFSYGFRPRGSPHDALDALAVAIRRRRVNWMLDTDIRDFFTSLDHRWLERVPRAADRGPARVAADPQVAQGGGDRGRGLVGERRGDAARGVGFAAARERLPALLGRPVGRAVDADGRAAT
jgi:hypothetical protein